MKAYIPLLLCSIAIFIASSISVSIKPDLGFDLQDKLLHAVAYNVYGLSVLLFIRGTLRVDRTSKVWIYLLLIGCLFAASDEFHQSFVPNRSAELLDFLADCIGVSSAMIWDSMTKRLVTSGFFR